MSAGQKDGTGAQTELDDAAIRKDDILSNREKSQRPAGQSLDSTGVQVDEYKDIPTNQRPKTGAGEEGSSGAGAQVDRPGFDLGGASGDTDAGRGLGLDEDAKDDKAGFKLPRNGAEK